MSAYLKSERNLISISILHCDAYHANGFYYSCVFILFTTAFRGSFEPRYLRWKKLDGLMEMDGKENNDRLGREGKATKPHTNTLCQIQCHFFISGNYSINVLCK